VLRPLGDPSLPELLQLTLGGRVCLVTRRSPEWWMNGFSLIKSKRARLIQIEDVSRDEE
jgi:hypothetical protein